MVANNCVQEHGRWQASWQLKKYANQQAYERRELAEPAKVFGGNLLLNEGISKLLTLLIGGTATTFNNSNAYLGVGNSTVASIASQTGLQGGSKKYRAMATGYPVIASQTVTFLSIYSSSQGNFAWNEVTVANGGSDAADNLNRKVQSLGTKSSPSVWALQLNLTIS